MRERETKPDASLLQELRNLRARVAQLEAREAECRRARESLERQSAYLEALHETALGLIRRLETQELLEAIIRRAGGLVGTEHGYIYLLDDSEETLTVRIGVGAFRGCVGHSVRKGEGLAGRVWEQKKTLAVEDYRRWPGRIPCPEYDPIRAIVGVPLYSDSRVSGVIALAYLEEGRRFSEPEIGVLERFAELASVTLENARLWKELRQAEERYRSLFDHVPVGLYRTTPDGRFLDANPALVEMSGCPDRESLLRHHVQEFYVNPEDRRRWQELMEREGVVRDFEARIRRRDGKIFWIKDSARAIRDGQGRVICYEGEIEDITERKRLEEAKRRLAQRTLQAQEQERLHLARELHDTLGQLLTALKMDAEWIAKQADRPEAVRRLAEDLCRRLDEAMEAVRSLSRGLRPAMLDDWGLGPALEALVEEFRAQTPEIRWDVVLEGPLEELPRETATTLYRIAQEALTNAVRHAQARSVRLELRMEDGQAVLRVEDDGRGIPEEALRSPDSLGIIGMRERAALVDGKLRVEARRPQGTRVLAEIPYPRVARASHLNPRPPSPSGSGSRSERESTTGRR